MAEYLIQDATLKGIADAIRSKNGTSGAILTENMANAISDIPVGGNETPTTEEKTVTPTTSTQEITATNADYLSKVIVNAMPTATQATPSISINNEGKITASATQDAGYVPAGTKSATKQLSTQAGKTVTPSSSEQTAVPSGVYTTGEVKVAAIPSNYIIPSGSTTLTKNSTYDVSKLASVLVNVPVPSGYLIPSGTKEITKNGTHDVASYASVSVNVASGGGGATVTGYLSFGGGEGTVTYQGPDGDATIDFSEWAGDITVVVGSFLFVEFSSGSYMGCFCEGDSMTTYPVMKDSNLTCLAIIVPNENFMLNVAY